MGDFAQQVQDFNLKCMARFRAAARMSAQEVVSKAQTIRQEGGRMRLVTGFLRASIVGAIDTIPSGPTTNESKATYLTPGSQVSGDPIGTVILRWDPTKGQRLVVGWTANYARFREYHDGFLRGAIEQWDEIADIAVARVRRELG